MIKHVSTMEHINRRIYLVVLTLRISSFGYKLIQEPLQKRTKLLLDSEISGGCRNRQFCDATFSPVHSTRQEFVNGGFTLKTHQMFSVHTTPQEFVNGGFTLKTHQMFSVHTTPQEFVNGGFTLKTHQMFSVQTTPEESKNAAIIGHFGFVFEEISGRGMSCLS